MKKTAKLLIATAAPLIVSASNLFGQIAPTATTAIGTGSLYITAPNYSATGDQAGPYSVQIETEAGVKPASTTFQTFCIGTEVDYSPGSTFSYQISDNVEPYTANQAPGSYNVGTPGYVTWGTAYLYSEYLAGGFGSLTITQEDALQVAIWDLQQQPIIDITLSPGETIASAQALAAATFLEDATNAATAAHISSVENEANGAFGVYALDMYSGSTYVQPQLVEVPCVPEPATFAAGAMLLVPLGVSALRKLRKKS
jgi:hypothetical protein